MRLFKLLSSLTSAGLEVPSNNSSILGRLTRVTLGARKRSAGKTVVAPSPQSCPSGFRTRFTGRRLREPSQHGGSWVCGVLALLAPRMVNDVAQLEERLRRARISIIVYIWG